jgi:hypothetical protein
MRKTKNKSSNETVIYTREAPACDAGGCSAAACHRGMDQMTYDALITHASWR